MGIWNKNNLIYGLVGLILLVALIILAKVYLYPKEINPNYQNIFLDQKIREQDLLVKKSLVQNLTIPVTGEIVEIGKDQFHMKVSQLVKQGNGYKLVESEKIVDVDNLVIYLVQGENERESSWFESGFAGLKVGSEVTVYSVVYPFTTDRLSAKKIELLVP